MPVPDLVRDSFFGQIVYYASGKRFFRYPEEKEGFVLPPRYANVAHLPSPPPARSRDSRSSAHTSYSETLSEDGRATRRASGDGTGPVLSEKQAEVHIRESNLQDEPIPVKRTKSEVHEAPHLPRHESTAAEEVLHLHGHDAQKAELGLKEEEAENPYIVDWYGPDDPESPQNVSATLYIALLRSDLSWKVVLLETLLCHFPNSMAYLCDLHWFSHLRPGHTRFDTKVPYLYGCR